MEMAYTHALLRRASRGSPGPVVRLYQPADDVVAFGRRDTLRPRFRDAVRVCRDAGFRPVVRPSGGRAVAYTSSSIVVDLVAPDRDAVGGVESRFVSLGTTYVDVLRQVGIDARLGEVTDEYCPGEFSVNARGLVKLVGTAQRIVRRAWLFGAVLVVDDAPRLREVYAAMYPHLDLAFDPASVGSVRDEAPEVRVDDLRHRLLSRLGAADAVVETAPDGPTLAEARDLVARHRVRAA